MIRLKQQRMSKAFMKTHLLGMPFSAVIHRFRTVDEGDAHDHPFAFTSTILYGGYIEQIFFVTDQGVWDTKTVHRKPGDTFRVEATCIHKIIELPHGECYTIILPEAKVREVHFWRFDEQGASCRLWNKRSFKPYKLMG
ncbi:MAG: hypothetical protein EOP45_06435 [Sphingobacteriaceae bacterium]|nr:MAG: hypothetical protein EOP45_06435 [Sphingobacteriaceae bacterium]